MFIVNCIMFTQLASTAPQMAGIQAFADLSISWRISLSVLELLLSIIIIAGNGIIIAAYVRTHQLRSRTNLLLVHLAIADLAVGVVIPISIATYYISEDAKTRSLCVIRSAIIGG